MTENERIQEWAGDNLFDGRRSSAIKPLYDSDPSAWTPALFQKIEDAGLRNVYIAFIMWPENFANRLSFRSCIHGQVTAYEEAIKRLAFATPAQKASALARAIEEMEAK